MSNKETPSPVQLDFPAVGNSWHSSKTESGEGFTMWVELWTADSVKTPSSGS